MCGQHHVIVGVVIGIRGAGEQFEIILRRLQRRHRRQRSNGLAVFNAFVESLARLRIAGVGQDRAVAERAGTGFGRALIHRDDTALRHHERHQIGDRVEAFRRRDIADPLRGDVIGLERADDVLLCRRRAAIEGVRHRRAARGAGEMREQPGGADGDAGIAGDRRHPQMQARVALLGFGEPGLIEMFEQPHIADRVQRDAAGQHQPAGARDAQQVIDDMDHGVLEHQLRRGSLVEAVLGIGAVMDVLDPQHRVRIPELVRPERFA